jgi:hypothetical protein
MTVYLTRHHRGIQVFKEAERKAMADMEEARALAAKRRRESKGQKDLFPAVDLHNNEYFDGLRERYLESNAARLLAYVESNGIVSYDELWAISLRSPLIWPSDINSYLTDMVKKGRLELLGLGENARPFWIRSSPPKALVGAFARTSMLRGRGRLFARRSREPSKRSRRCIPSWDCIFTNPSISDSRSDTAPTSSSTGCSDVGTHTDHRN